MSDSESPGGAHRRVARRDLLRAGAVAGGTVFWVAPVVRTVAAVAQEVSPGTTIGCLYEDTGNTINRPNCFSVGQRFCISCPPTQCVATIGCIDETAGCGSVFARVGGSGDVEPCGPCQAPILPASCAPPSG
jgi:hypothetical protein